MIKNKNSMSKPPFEGVNLGGWLLVERWMTPSLFKDTDAQDEFSLMQTKIGATRIEKHRKSFITEQDWKWLATNNVAYVRLPVGYWVLKSDPPYKHAQKHLDWAFAMAEKYHIYILLDLHALKGSQNGTMHSGKVGPVQWRRHEQESLVVLKELALRYRESPALWGIEIINEPKVIGNYIALLRYYRDAYTLLRGIVKPGTYTVFQDGFAPLLFSGTLWQRKKYPIAMDTHFYLAFPKLLSKLSPQKYDYVRKALFGTALLLTCWRQPLIVGEWSSILPQEMFNRTPQAQHYAMLADTIERQRRIYHRAMGRFYWNYKTEGEGMYNYRSLVETGTINT
jgi:glucan 1,3-beta-glucosidase